MPRKPLALAATVLLALLAPAAHAAIIPGQVIDGPNNLVQRFGDVDMAPDGTGALAYVKKVGMPSAEHVFVSRFAGGSWTSPEDVTTTANCPCSVPHVAAGNGGRVVVVFSDQVQNAQAAIKPNASSPFQLTSPDAGTGAVVMNEDVDMDPVSGVAYAIENTGNGGHVAAARLVGTTWSTIDTGNVNHFLDHSPADDFSAGGTGPQTEAAIAVDSAGNAVAVWPEQDATMKGHIYVRRISGTTAAPTSQDVSVASIAGHNEDFSNVDSVDIDGGGSPNPWIVFRQQFTYGVTGRVRDLARQLVGDTLSPAQVLDGLPLDSPTEGAEFPRVDVNPAGQGLSALPRQLSFQSIGSTLAGGVWAPGFRLDSGTPTAAAFPVPAIADSGNGLISWVDTSGPTTRILARDDVGGVFSAPVTLSVDSLGGVLGGDLQTSSSAAGTTAVGFAQSNGTQSSIVAAVVDLPQPTTQPAGPAAKPAVSGLRFSRKVFAQGRKVATVSRKRRHKVGTTISFNVSLQSKTTFSFAKKTKGFRSGRRCVAHRPKGHRKARRCTRYVKRGSMSFSTAAGTHRVHFEGRLSRRKRLKPGSYRLTVVSTNSAGRSPAKRASFRLLKR